MQQNYTVIVAMYATSCTYPGRILLFLSNFIFRTGHIFFTIWHPTLPASREVR